MNNIIVSSRKNISAIAHDYNFSHIIISITDDNNEFADIDSNDKCLGILRLKFGDVDNEKLATMDRVTLFNKHQASQILAFVSAHYNDIETIIVNCDAGVSRSAGVALALHRIFNIDPEAISGNSFYHPNFHVVNTIYRQYIAEV